MKANDKLAYTHELMSGRWSLRELGSQAKSHSRAPATEGVPTIDAFLNQDQLTVLLMIGAREVKDEKGDEDALRFPTSRANLLASHVAVLVSFDEVDRAMMNEKDVSASIVLKALTLLMRVAETLKYEASWLWMLAASLVLVRKAVCKVDKRAPAT